MEKILFVCHGNICRSPMAEFIFKALAEARGASSLPAKPCCISDHPSTTASNRILAPRMHVSSF